MGNILTELLIFAPRVVLSRGHFVEKLLSSAALATLGSSPVFSDTLYFNGDILTKDGPEPVYAEAVVEKEGKIALVGLKSAAEVTYPDAVLHDLAGQTMLPGFLDPHGHFMFALNMVNQVNVADPPVEPVTAIPVTIAALEAFKRERNLQSGDWIVG